MTVKLTYRELQRLSIARLLMTIGNDVCLVYADSQLVFKVKAASEKDILLDSQAIVRKKSIRDSQAMEAKSGVGLDSQANRHEYADSQAKTDNARHGQLDSQAGRRGQDDSQTVVIGGRRFKRAV